MSDTMQSFGFDPEDFDTAHSAMQHALQRAGRNPMLARVLVAADLATLTEARKRIDQRLLADAASAADADAWRAQASQYGLTVVAQGADRQTVDNKALQALAGAVASELLQLAKEPRKVSARQLIALAEKLQNTPTKTSKGRAAHIRGR